MIPCSHVDYALGYSLPGASWTRPPPLPPLPSPATVTSVHQVTTESSEGGREAAMASHTLVISGLSWAVPTASHAGLICLVRASKFSTRRWSPFPPWALTIMYRGKHLPFLEKASVLVERLQ